MTPKRFLLVTTNFAPRGTSHAIRTVHLARDLRRLGHEVAVLTYQEQAQLLFSPPDPSLTAKAAGIETVRRIAPGFLHRWTARARKRGDDPQKIRRRGTRSILSSLVIPDPHVGAYRSFVSEASHLVEHWRPDVLVTFSYPFTLTLVGAAIKRRHPHLRWIADYGDPWTGSPVTELNLPAWRRAVDRRLEQRALSSVDAVSMTTTPTADLYRRLFPMLDDRVHVLTMGYDPDDTDSISAAPRPPEDRNRVILLHAGRLYGEARDPRPFVDALEALCAERPDLADRLRVDLLGEVESSLAATIRASRAAGIVRFQGWVTVEESLARMKAADGLILFGNRGEMQIPGKVYQYIGTGRPILMVCESAQDPTVDVLQRAGRAEIVPNRTEDLTATLERLTAAGPVPASADAGCPEFAWPTIAAKLAALAAPEVAS